MRGWSRRTTGGSWVPVVGSVRVRSWGVRDWCLVVGSPSLFGLVPFMGCLPLPRLIGELFPHLVGNLTVQLDYFSFHRISLLGHTVAVIFWSVAVEVKGVVVAVVVGRVGHSDLLVLFCRAVGKFVWIVGGKQLVGACCTSTRRREAISRS